MRSRRLLVGLIVPVALVALVALLASLQYKWLGQVSEAERDRLRTTLRQGAEDLRDEFDRELTRIHQSLQVDGDTLLGHNWEPFAARYDAWRERAKDAHVIKSIYFTSDEAGAGTFVYRPEARRFEASTLPNTLAPVQASLATWQEAVPFSRMSSFSTTTARAGGQGGGGVTRSVFSISHQVFPSVPALLISMPTASSVQDLASITSMSGATAHTRRASLIVEIDREHVRTVLLPALVTRYFPHGADQYRFAVVDTSDKARSVYTRGVPANGEIDPQHADATVTMFALRPELTAQLLVKPTATATIRDGGFTLESRVVTATPVAPTPAPPPPARAGSRIEPSTNVSIVLGGRTDVFNFRPQSRGGWQMAVQHTAGSLDLAVGQARRRNLWLSFGILGVLAAGVGLIVINAERSRKLAVQQMDFVATVSHELRTPLTVIRSAAQNLSAGVVSDPAQAKRYGDLIETEGRRLTDMVEQVLEFAGLSGNRKLARAQPIDVGAVSRDVIESSAALFESERIEVDLQIADHLPPVLADDQAVRRALNNLIANAVKYGADGRWIGVSVRRAGATTKQDEVQVTVSDRGRGIEPNDLPHIFEAFYRGRYAVDRQIHGNGLGLSLVKRIAEAHGGKVTVTSTPGAGATFTLHFPAASPDPAAYPAQPDPIAESSTPTA